MELADLEISIPAAAVCLKMTLTNAQINQKLQKKHSFFIKIRSDFKILEKDLKLSENNSEICQTIDHSFHNRFRFFFSTTDDSIPMLHFWSLQCEGSPSQLVITLGSARKPRRL